MCTIRFLQEPFLSSCLTSFALRLSKMPRYSLQIEQGSEASFIEPSVAGHALEGLLASIETTLSRMHPAIVLVCRVWYNATKKKFPGSELAAVGGIFFLRFMCPVITILAASDQTDVAYQNSFIKHRQLIQLVAKILLGICNQISSFKEVRLFRNFSSDKVNSCVLSGVNEALRIASHIFQRSNNCHLLEACRRLNACFSA
jgi:hypothetical protein